MAGINNQLKGRRIAILATKGVEEVELTKPKKALEDAGAKVDVIAPQSGIKGGKIRAWDMTDWGDEIPVDVVLKDARSENYDALHLPGGVMNPDYLRLEPAAIEFVRTFIRENKPIAAICHAAWTLIDADGVRGHTMTSWPSLQTDLRNAGAEWVDREVVQDSGLVTSRKPDDIPAYNNAMIELFSSSASHHAAA
ncbi:type 1 glutamine amidotransferase domain-containing protein [Edaphobacter sp. HDX4]|uniref:type 1 glutamine amidotransferase domain-containing protein n=1 Tax=Edaphobacter sp. HDX4 TaxID=2794064 RepID=UPI002FE5DB52